MEIVGIDVGRRNVKVVTGSTEKVFQSIVGEYRELNNPDKLEYAVTVDGTKYFIGDLAFDESEFSANISTVSKINLETKVLFLSAIALVTSDPDVRIITGLPMDQIGKSFKAELTELLRGDHIVKIGTGKERKFSITSDNILIAPEGAGIYWDHVADNDGSIRNVELTKGTVRIIDIGSKTINYCTNRKHKLIERDSSTIDRGMIGLDREDVNDNMKERFIRANIAGKLAKKWQDIRPEDYIIASGGGGFLLSHWIKNEYPSATFPASLEDAIISNARGFYKLGVRKWQEK